MNDADHPPSGSNFWLTVAGVVGCFLVFAIVLYVAYLPAQSAAQNRGIALTAEDLKAVQELAPAEREARLAELRWERGVPSAEDRKARLQELRNKEAAGLAGYAWVDREKGVVRLPINRAMELTVAELQAKQKAAK